MSEYTNQTLDINGLLRAKDIQITFLLHQISKLQGKLSRLNKIEVLNNKRIAQLEAKVSYLKKQEETLSFKVCLLGYMLRLETKNRPIFEM